MVRTSGKEAQGIMGEPNLEGTNLFQAWGV